jgi:hypothetical protein
MQLFTLIFFTATSVSSHVPADQTPFEIWNDLCIKVGLTYKCDETLTVLFLSCAQLLQLFLSLNAQCQDIRSHFLNMPLIQECC